MSRQQTHELDGAMTNMLPQSNVISRCPERAARFDGWAAKSGQPARPRLLVRGCRAMTEPHAFVGVGLAFFRFPRFS